MSASLTSSIPTDFAARVALPGDLTSTTVAEARPLLAQAVDRVEQQPAGARTLRIDMMGARMIDSVGLNTLVGVIKRVRGFGGEVTVVISHASVERILTFTRLNTLVRVLRIS